MTPILRKLPLAWLIFSLPSSAHSQNLPVTESLDGKTVYLQLCAGCHGQNLEGVNAGPLIKDNWLYGTDPKRMLTVIQYGIAGTEMAPWSTVLSKEQCEAVRDYIIDKQTHPPDNERAIPQTVAIGDRILSVENLTPEGIDTPWAIEFVDARRQLVTERSGGLRWIVDGQLVPEPVQGIPDVLNYGTSGMMDLALDPDYAQNGWVYLSYSHGLGPKDHKTTPGMTKIIRGRIENNRWTDEETLFQMPDKEYLENGGRWGCRLLIDKDRYLYFSIGDMGRNDDVQNLSKPVGKWYRIHLDGSIPKDNPFVATPGAIPQIFTIGNRNNQGIAQHPETGELWVTEHGPMGGDELNILKKGGNYGWPLVTYGIDYDGSTVSSLTEKKGMLPPVKYWTPSPALCAAEFYTSDLIPEWKGSLLLSALAFEEIKRLEIKDGEVVAEELILKNVGRVRDIKSAPDGSLYVALNRPDAVIRLAPKQ